MYPGWFGYSQTSLTGLEALDGLALGYTGYFSAASENVSVMQLSRLLFCFTMTALPSFRLNTSLFSHFAPDFETGLLHKQQTL